MRLILLSLFSLFNSIAGGYILDDRDSAITYIPSSGPSKWQQFPDAPAYRSTTTDNACITQQGCRFRFSFNGSGISLARFIITSISIPLNATVTIDGRTRPMILIPDGSPDVTVYNLQSLEYGVHSAEVTLMSYKGSTSHFRLDSVNINETVVTTTTTTSQSPPSIGTATELPSETSLKATPMNLASKKVPIGVIVGGTIGGIVMTVSMAWLLHALKRRQRYSRSVEGLGPEAIISPFVPSVAETNLPTTTSIGTVPISEFLPHGYHSPTSTTSTVSAYRPALPSQGNQCLNDDQVAFVAGLYRQRMPAPAVARVVEAILRDRELSGDDGPGNDSESSRQCVAPPAYDFKLHDDSDHHQ